MARLATNLLGNASSKVCLWSKFKGVGTSTLHGGNCHKFGDYSYSHSREIDLWKRYITSLYFAVVTMATVGYGEIHAVNVREMIFIMFYVSFDMLLGGYLLGNITALIVKRSKTEKFRDKMAELQHLANASCWKFSSASSATAHPVAQINLVANSNTSPTPRAGNFLARRFPIC